MDFLFRIVIDIGLDGIPSLFKTNLSKSVHRLRIIAWFVIMAFVVSFFLTYVSSLEPHTRILKNIALGNFVIFIVTLASITLKLKSDEES